MSNNKIKRGMDKYYKKNKTEGNKKVKNIKNKKYLHRINIFIKIKFKN